MRTFGHLRPGESGFVPSPVRVKTQGRLGPQYGPDRDKRLVMTAHGNDLIGLRPQHTRRELFVGVFDVYAMLVRRQAQKEQLEKARARKARKASR